MASATVSSKGQVTIPARIRTLLGLDMGSRIEFIPQDNGQVSIEAIDRTVHSLKGLVRKPAAPVSIEDMNAAIIAGGANAK